MRREHSSPNVDIGLIDLRYRSGCWLPGVLRPHLRNTSARPAAAASAARSFKLGEDERCAAGSDARAMIAGLDRHRPKASRRMRSVQPELRRRASAVAAMPDARRTTLPSSFDSEIGTRPAFSSKMTLSLLDRAAIAGCRRGPARMRCRHWDDRQTASRARGVKMRDLGGVGGVFRRQHEGRFRQIEFGGDAPASVRSKAPRHSAPRRADCPQIACR